MHIEDYGTWLQIGTKLIASPSSLILRDTPLNTKVVLLHHGDRAKLYDIMAGPKVITTFVKINGHTIYIQVPVKLEETLEKALMQAIELGRKRLGSY